MTTPFTASITVNVTDPGSTLGEVYIFADAPGQSREVVYASGATGEAGGVGIWGTRYATGTRVAITDGFAYTFARAGGFIGGSLTLTSHAVDIAGTLTVAQNVYTITYPPLAAPGTTGVVQPGDVGFACHPQKLTQQDVLDLFDRTMDDSYMQGIKQADGYELLEAYAKGLERAALATGHLECGLFIMSAEGPARAQGVVEFYRPSGAAGSVTVLAGTIVSTSINGRRFHTLEPAVFTGSAVGPVQVRAEAIAPGFEYNVLGAVTTAGGEAIPGEIDVAYRCFQSPAYADPTIVVRQQVDFVGGNPGMLDQLGLDRNIARADGEGDSPYRARIRQLPDTISPAAIRRAVSASLSKFNIPYKIIETWQADYQTCYDAPNTTFPSNFRYSPNTFVYDDPRPVTVDTFMNRWLGIEDMRSAFIVVIPRTAAMLDVGLSYDDDTSDTLDAFSNQLGRRALTAYDVAADVTAAFLQGCYDGFDVGRSVMFAGLYDVLQQIKAGGVLASVEIAPDYPS